MKFKYCPKCAGKLKPHHKLHYKCQKCGFIFWQNSKPTASAIIVNDKNQVLLGRRNIEPAEGEWDIPGGFLELGEHPETGLRREIQEELGVEIDIIKMLGIFMDTYGQCGDSTLNICYLAKIAKGTPVAADDVGEIKWFSAKELPKNMAFKNGREMLDAWLGQLQ